MAYSKGRGLQEIRVIFEIFTYYFYTVPTVYGNYIINNPDQKSIPVVMFPGFLHDDNSLKNLRYILKNRGYPTYGGNQGRNLGFTDKLKSDMIQRVKTISQAHNTKVALVGGSLGGIYVREISKEIPDCVEAVITLGTPVNINKGDCTNVYFIYDFLNRKNKVSEELLAKVAEKPPVRTLAILSPVDGVVNFDFCYDDNCENKVVKSSHLGFKYNESVVKEIVKFIERKE